MNIPPWMKPEGSLSCSQAPAAGPYPERDESAPHFTRSLCELPVCSTVPSPRMPPGWCLSFSISVRVLSVRNTQFVHATLYVKAVRENMSSCQEGRNGLNSLGKFSCSSLISVSESGCDYVWVPVTWLKLFEVGSPVLNIQTYVWVPVIWLKLFEVGVVALQCSTFRLKF
jgi:hypothetical protein